MARGKVKKRRDRKLVVWLNHTSDPKKDIFISVWSRDIETAEQTIKDIFKDSKILGFGKSFTIREFRKR